MAAITAEHGWDGEWFLRAYDHFGNPVGSGKNAEAQIFLEPQGMCVMAGIGLAPADGSQAGFGAADAAEPASGRLAERALASVKERLATPHGIMLLQPAFT